MFIVERLLSLVAPHRCVICGAEGSLVCVWCKPDFALPLPSRCFRCKVLTADSAVCKKCRRQVKLGHVWVCGEYEKHIKLLIHGLKFENQRAAAQPMADMMSACMPFQAKGTIVTHVPTATNRIRKRGYDQAQLLAKAVARELDLPYRPVLHRVTYARQVGASRTQRFKQMEGAFRAQKVPSGAKVLLVDDLTTTGATLESAARCLRAAGVKTVDAVVFAQKQIF